MSDIAHAGRIPETAFKACLGLFLGVSILAVAARITIRMKTRHNLYADDAFLLFGLACMCVVTALAYTMMSSWYLEEIIITDHERPLLSAEEESKLILCSVISDTCVVLAWTAEFSVKASLLLFFKQLVERLPRLTLYVKCVMACTALVWAVCICQPFMVCSHFGVSSLTQCGITIIHRAIGLMGLIMTLDIFTDIMIFSIPILFLWKASFSIKQKIYIGGFLTVNIWLIFIALARVIPFKQGITFDFTWTLFFQIFEPHVAILAACFSAFRSLFVNHGQRHQPDPSFGRCRRLLGQKPSVHHQLDEFPSVQAPTHKGMQPMTWQINRTKASNLSSSDTALFSATEGVDEISLEQGTHDRDDQQDPRRA